MKLLLHGKKFSKEVGNQINTFVNDMIQRNIEIIYTKSFFNLLEKRINQHNNKKKTTITSLYKDNDSVDFLVCFGGDGTILDAVTIVKNTEIPIIGINTGRLGFLATISKNEIPLLMTDLFNKKYTLSNRTLLQIEVQNNHLNFPFALNEISVLSKENSAMINVKVFIDEEYLNTYWADGLIISTPTGSTGYSLSCGGPIVMPESNNFIITPIAPHNLNVRPLIINDNSIVRIEIVDTNNKRKFLLSMDSRNEYLHKDCSIVLKKADFKIKLLKLESTTSSKTIRNKLLWGLDSRSYEKG